MNISIFFKKYLQLSIICGNITIVRDTTNKYIALTERGNKMSLDIKAVHKIYSNLDNIDKVDVLIICVYGSLDKEQQNKLYDKYYNDCDNDDKIILDCMCEKSRLINFISYYSGKLSVKLLDSTDELLQCKNENDIIKYIFS